MKAGLSEEEGKPPEGWSGTCKDSGTASKTRVLEKGLENILRARLPAPPPTPSPTSGLSERQSAQVEKPVGQVEMSHKGFITQCLSGSSRPTAGKLGALLTLTSPTPAHARRPQPWPSLHANPSMPWALPCSPGPSYRPPQTRTSWAPSSPPLSLSFLVFEMESITFSF